MATAESIRSTTARADSFRANMPLLSLVPEPQKRSLPSPELVSVAGHELNHALVALTHGAPVISISVIPEGNSLGRTVLGGLVSLETMKVIAAGGGVETHEGHSEGFGSDKYRVDVLHHFHGGHSWESARGQAASALSVYSREVRRKAAEIIAYLGRVSGSLLSEIMLRAQMEVNEEKHQNNELFVPIFIQNNSKDQTIIENLPNNISKIIYVVVGKIEKEEFICGNCQGVNGHAKECPKSELREDSKENPFSMPKLFFPRKGAIFFSSKN